MLFLNPVYSVELGTKRMIFRVGVCYYNGYMNVAQSVFFFFVLFSRSIC